MRNQFQFFFKMLLKVIRSVEFWCVIYKFCSSLSDVQEWEGGREDEHSAVVCDGHGDLSDMTGVSESILHLLQQGDPEPVRKCSP